MSGALDVLSRAERMLAEVATAQDAANVRDLAEAARQFAKQAKLGTAAVNHATAIKLKAEIRVAECVEEGQRQGTIATNKDGGRPPTKSVRSTDTLTPQTLDELGIDRRRLDESRRIAANWTPEAVDAAIAEATAEDVTVARKDFIKGKAHTRHNSGEYEFYTPRYLIAAAREVLGSIDLDPASSLIANRTVDAASIYTIDDDGLAQRWQGRVWLNPPFQRGLVAAFTGKLLRHHAAGDVPAAITVTHNGTETAWGQDLLNASAAVCFPRGRINFNDSDGSPRTESGALQGQMIVYLGPDRAGFRDVFQRIGAVL